MGGRSRLLRAALPLILLALLCGVGGGLAGGLIVRLAGDDGSSSSSATPVAEPQVVVEGEAAIPEIVQQALPSVVTVVNKLGTTEDPYGTVTDQIAAGSGVIIDERGYIVTNQHVVDSAEEITVTLHDGEERPASLVSADDPFTDLAVIKIAGGDLQAVSWGDSDALEPGEPVVAIGSALEEFRDSVTVGVVSGSHRRWSGDGVVMEDLVQTDAALNHGNSGGALLNMKGELIGLNTSVVRRTDNGEVVEGIAFAISSNVAAPIVQAIIDDGSYPRAYLGIVHRDITPDLAPFADLPVDYGALVVRVSPGTPAAEAGIEEGDIILQMGDMELNEDMPFLNALGRLQPGQTVTVVVNRGGDEISLDVGLVARERQTQ